MVETQLHIPSQFPAVSGRNLERQIRHFPEDFDHRWNLVFVAFWQHQQTDIDSWLPLATRLEDQLPDFKFYELPVIEGMGPLGRLFLNEGMRAGIPAPDSRERTTTLYIHKAPFLEALQIEAQDAIQVLLVDEDGQILSRASGAYSHPKGDSFLAKMGTMGAFRH